ncbi:MAG: iron-containing alcohol dehydrogenase [Acidobacteriota bacterium]
MLESPTTYALKALSTLRPPQKPLAFIGPGSSEELADLLIASGHRRPLLVTGTFLLSRGRLDGLLERFRSQGCDVTIFDGVVPNPTFAVVEDALGLSRANGCDSVFAVGGGSAIDVGKVVAAASVDGRDLHRLAGLFKIKKTPLPLYAVPTTSGSGSEATAAAVISDTQSHRKTFFVDPTLVPIAAALDPELLKTLPAGMTAAVGMDALTHAIEAFTSRNRFPDSDRDAALAIQLLFEFLPTAYRSGDDLKARERVALASFLAGYAFAKSSLGYVHAISHQISAHYDTPHGLANAVILPRILRFNRSASAERFAALETRLANGSADRAASTASDLANRFIARVDALGEEIGIPGRLEELEAKDFPSIIRRARSEARRSYAAPRAMRPVHVEAVLRSIATGQLEPSFG